MFELPPAASEPEIVELYEYWRSKSPPGKLPGRQHSDPAAFSPRLLPHILLADVERTPDGPRFRLRVAGTSVVEMIGRDMTGRYFDEVAPADRTGLVIAALRTIVETGEPVFLESQLTVPSRDFIWVKRLGLPLARDGETVDMVLASFHSAPKPPATDVAASKLRPFSGEN